MIFVIATRLITVFLLLGTVLRSTCLAQINLDEDVAYHGAYLFWDGDAKLTMALRGRFFEPEKDGAVRRLALDRVITPAVFRSIGKKSTDFDDAARDLMYDRLSPFLADGESRESLKMRVIGRGGAATLTLPKTDSGGHFAITTATAGNQSLVELVGNGRDLLVHAVLPEGDKRQDRFTVRLRVPPKRLPLLVVSDVDDTVRIAEVTNRARMIERVFLQRYEAVPGMSAVYRQLADRGAQFHFVSGSPWQIAPLIEGMLADSKFPPATLHCRNIGWDFWNGDPLDTHRFKVETIESLLQRFDSRKVLLVGDDGEHDPEVYRDICRDHPDRVAGVWIRRVRETWDATRLAEPTKLLGPARAVAFEHSSELEQALEKIEISR